MKMKTRKIKVSVDNIEAAVSSFLIATKAIQPDDEVILPIKESKGIVTVTVIERN